MQLGRFWPNHESRWQRARRILGRPSLAERLLLALSHDPQGRFVSGGYVETCDQWEGDPLSEWRRGFADFEDMVRGKTVLDYGCGNGYQVEAIAKLGATHVHGVDIAQQRVAHAARRIAGIPNASVDTRIGDRNFDVVLSLNAFEHFPEPEQNLGEMAAAVRSGGCILLSFGPLWWAPYGAHMHFMTSVPWLQLWFSEETVHRVRRLFRSDSSMTYASAVNRMTVRRFYRLVRRAGLTIERIRLRPVGGARWLARIPGVQEFFVNQIEAMLRRP